MSIVIEKVHENSCFEDDLQISQCYPPSFEDERLSLIIDVHPVRFLLPEQLLHVVSHLLIDSDVLLLHVLLSQDSRTGTMSHGVLQVQPDLKFAVVEMISNDREDCCCRGLLCNLLKYSIRKGLEELGR